MLFILFYFDFLNDLFNNSDICLAAKLYLGGSSFQRIWTAKSRNATRDNRLLALQLPEHRNFVFLKQMKGASPSKIQLPVSRNSAFSVFPPIFLFIAQVAQLENIL